MLRSYAVELGKVLLKSDKPITEAERSDAMERVCVFATGKDSMALNVVFVSASRPQP